MQKGTIPETFRKEQIQVDPHIVTHIPKTKVLLIEDNRGDARLIREVCAEAKDFFFDFVVAERLSSGLEYLAGGGIDIVLLDLSLPDSLGLDTFAKVRTQAPGMPVIILTGCDDKKFAVQAMRDGAQDYLIKEQVDFRFFPRAIHYAIERKRIEEKLKEAEQKTRAIVNTVGEGIIAIHQDSRIFFANQELCNTFGYSENELLGNKTEMLMPEKYKEDHANALKHYLERGESKVLGMWVEKEGLRKNGEVFPIKIRIEETMMTLKKDRFFTAAIQDITEPKKKEEALRKAKEEAEEATKLKDKFIGLVAHDLKGPLANLISFLELSRTQMGVQFNHETVLDFLNTAINSGKEMYRLVEDLLDVAILKTGKITPRFKFADASVFAKEVLEGLEFIAKRKGVRLVSKVPKYTRVYADRALFYEVIQNLVSNAIKFCKKGDSVTIFVPEKEPSTIAVADTGTGIKPEWLNVIFSYERSTSTTGTAGETGTGLGLPFSREIMEAHGGTLRVDSVPGKGSTFYAQLPINQPKILLLEKDSADKEIINKMLKPLGVEIIAVENVKRAVDTLNKIRPHLILSDLLILKTNDFELLKVVKESPLLADIPVIVLMDQGEVNSRKQAVLLGVDDFITKPADFEKLTPIVEKYTGKV